MYFYLGFVYKQLHLILSEYYCISDCIAYLSQVVLVTSEDITLATRIKWQRWPYTALSESSFQRARTGHPTQSDCSNIYFIANDVDGNEKKRAILLSVCGAATYKLINEFAVCCTCKSLLIKATMRRHCIVQANQVTCRL